MSNKIYIPTFISNEDFEPARVQPRVLYYNGKLTAPEYRVYAWTASTGLSSFVYEMTDIPYFDHYSVTGSNAFPTADSKSLLFFNEPASQGIRPSNTLFSEYWETYLELLYNPVTRLITAQAVIPLAEYFELELNDIVSWRDNLYHLRAVNEYNLTTGECELQLLGPIIEDTLDPDSFGTCYNYSIVNNSVDDITVNYTTCDGVVTSSLAPSITSTNLGCVRSGSVDYSTRFPSQVTGSQGADCGTYPIYE